MPNTSLVRLATLAALVVFTLAYLWVWATVRRRQGSAKPTVPMLLTGFVTNFFDTLGIGSFAPTTAIFKFTKMVPDEWIPGTLNAGHTIPVILQAFLYIAVIEVKIRTLLSLILSAVVGSWIGAGWVSRMPKKKVQLGVGFALGVGFMVLLARQLNWYPAGGHALGLEGWKLLLAIGLNGLFAAVSTLGIGFYAPCMTMIGLLGMNPTAAFPIMMGSGAFLMPVASARFVREGTYSAPAAMGLTYGGLLGVPLAAFAVKSLPLEAARWLVMIVVFYAAIVMLRSAYTEKDSK